MTSQASKKRLRRNMRGQGFALIELMVSIAIMALLATTVAVAVMRYMAQARIDVAQTETRSIKTAVLTHRIGGGACPTMAELIEDGLLDEDQRTEDPWGHDYEVVCDGRRTVVWSSGPDGDAETEDDVSSRRSDAAR